MAVLHDCSCLRVLHTGRPGKFCWNVDGKNLWDRSCLLENRQQENARVCVPSAPSVSEAMKEKRRQKRNPYHWAIQALETYFFVLFYRKVQSIKFSSHDIVLAVFMATKKLAPIGRRM